MDDCGGANGRALIATGAVEEMEDGISALGGGGTLKDGRREIRSQGVPNIAEFLARLVCQLTTIVFCPLRQDDSETSREVGL